MFDKLTRKDIEKMEAEIEHRKLVVRKELIEAVKEARAQGESRIRYLEKMIKTATIIDDSSAEDEVGLNNTVEVYFEDDDETEKFKIVTTVRGNSLDGYISNESPMGKALLGHKKDDRVFVDMGNGAGYFVVIKSIENTVDDGTDELRSF